MLSKDAQAALAARLSLAASLQGLPPGHIATASTLLARESGESQDPITPARQDDLVTGPLSGSTPSDLRKPVILDEKLLYDALQGNTDWSLRMINDGVRLDEMLLSKEISDAEFADAARAHLQVRFPATDLNKYTSLTKDVKRAYVENWRVCMLALSVYYRHFKKFPTTSELYDYLGGRIDFDNINKYLGDENTDKALSELGVSSPTMGLSERQLLALSALSSFTDARPLPAKLRSLGINHWEFTNWLGYPKFASAYRKITEDLLSEVQPVINTALVQLATGATTGRPDLASIKYLNEVNGRFDPNARQVMDMRSFMTKVVDILTQELADDPAKLQRIGARLASAANSPQGMIEGSITPDPAA